jgi:hypothetical protein
VQLTPNQGLLHEDVATYFTFTLSPAAAVVTYDGGHGRVETRAFRVTGDIAFDEDSNRTSKGHSAANFAMIRHIALYLIKHEKKIEGLSQNQAFESRMG